MARAGAPGTAAPGPRYEFGQGHGNDRGKGGDMAGGTTVGLKTGAAFGLLLALSGCGENGPLSSLPNPFQRDGGAQSSGVAGGPRVVERDVEAPEAFQATAAGLWDGRPSLGGVWVAYPDVAEPERVIIRNEETGGFVIGALFRREAANPGPPFQVSSDAASALGMLAGQPAALNVTALRRESTAEPEPAGLPAPPEVGEAPLEPATGAPAPSTGADAPPSPAPAAAPQASGLERPFIQIGIFSVEANAERTAARMRAAGIVPTVLRQESAGKPFWRVIVGPARSVAERAALLETVREEGFTDAYFVTN